MYSALYFSPWPFSVGMTLLFLIFGLWLMLKGSLYMFLISTLILLFFIFMWVKDLNEENDKGYLSSMEIKLMKFGFILFILSEVMLFFSLFWCFFHSSLAAVTQSGGVWPPIGIMEIPCFGVPLINTVLLLLSAASLTWSHASRSNSKKESNLALFLTIMLGVAFIFLQCEEYMTSAFSMSDSVYGSIFFLATGFHGAHVMIGTLALLYSILVKSFLSYYPHSITFLFAAWYWHFVDVVWLFLFICVYWWGSL